MIRCPKCNKELEDGSKFCDACGARIYETIYCPNCGEPTSTEFAFCQKCGAPITEDIEVPADSAAPAQPQEKQSHLRALPGKAIALGGIAVIENAYDETYLIKGLSAAEIITEEPKLKEISYKTIAHLLFDKCDVLVVDKIGKNISGDGMDPNVSGRFVQPKYCSGGIDAEKVVILDITDETHGNAQGIGLAEVTTRRLVNRMKLEMTYPTGVTNTFLHLMKIPMIMDNDREALQLALMCCPEAEDPDNMKMIRIPNTAHIEYIEISEGMLPLAKANPNLEILSEPYDLPFDENGNLF